MAIKDMIAGGIGFSPGSVKFIPTRGLIAGPEIIFVPTPSGMLSAQHVRRSMRRGRSRR